MKKIIHIDMDSFYASVEMRDNPKLKNKPIAVGGSANNRGVIATANYIAREYGVHSAMPTAQAIKLCPTLEIVPARHDVYRKVSQQVRLIMEKYTDVIEFMSLDEAYLDVTNCKQYKGSATLIAKAIRTDIMHTLNLTASAGVAPVKFLAKIASDINKPNGQYVITPEEVPGFVNNLSLAKIPGVGKVTLKKLNDLGLYQCSDISQYDLRLLLDHFGKFGRILHERSLGIDEREVIPYREAKSLGVERTVATNINDWHECLKLINSLYDELNNRLKKHRSDLLIAKQGVKFKFDDFKITTQEHIYHQLNKDDFIKIAYDIWINRRNSRSVRLVGLHVILLDSETSRQLELELG